MLKIIRKKYFTLLIDALAWHMAYPFDSSKQNLIFFILEVSRQKTLELQTPTMKL